MSPTSRQAIIDLLSDRPIAYHPMLAKALGGVVEAVFASQLLYWTGKGKLAGGWIFKTQAEMEEETGLTRSNQQTARKNLIKLGVLEEARRGVPGKMHYRLNLDMLADLITMQEPHNVETQQCETPEPDNVDCQESAEYNAETPQSIPENTRENNHMPQSGENGKIDKFDLPSAEIQVGILFGGRTNGNGHLNLEDAEMRLLRSGWNIRGKEIKDACVYLLAVTGWDVPAGDSTRRDWHNGLKEHLEFGAANLPDYYTEAYRRLKAARQRDPDFSIPPRPQTFTKIMGAIREERKEMQGQFVEEGGKRYRIVK